MAHPKNKQMEFNQSILKDLKSKDNAKVKTAFKKISNKGDETTIQPLIDLYNQSQDDTIKKEIKNIFSQLKITKAIPVLIKNIKHENNRVKELVLYSIWSSNLDAHDHIQEIISTACSSDYMVALEALTIIENLDGPFKEEDLIEGMITINEYLSGEMDDKQEIIRSLSETLKIFEEQIQI